MPRPAAIALLDSRRHNLLPHNHNPPAAARARAGGAGGGTACCEVDWPGRGGRWRLAKRDGSGVAPRLAPQAPPARPCCWRERERGCAVRGCVGMAAHLTIARARTSRTTTSATAGSTRTCSATCLDECLTRLASTRSWPGHGGGAAGAQPAAQPAPAALIPGGAEGVARRNEALLSTRRTTSLFVGISLTCTALSWAWKATTKSDREHRQAEHRQAEHLLAARGRGSQAPACPAAVQLPASGRDGEERAQRQHGSNSSASDALLRRATGHDRSDGRARHAGWRRHQRHARLQPLRTRLRGRGRLPAAH